jgi:glycosyltransferase involved in cell wall biosynthesis
LAQALAKYVDSADLRLRHGAEARQQVEARFTLSGMVDRYAALYNEALGSRLEHRVAVRAS